MSPAMARPVLTPGYTVCILMQEPILDDTKTVTENVSYGRCRYFLSFLARFNEI